MKISGGGSRDVGQRYQVRKIEDVRGHRADLGEGRIAGDIAQVVSGDGLARQWIKQGHVHQVAAAVPYLRVGKIPCPLIERGHGREGIVRIARQRAVEIQKKERLRTAVVNFRNRQRPAQVGAKALLKIPRLGGRLAG